MPIFIIEGCDNTGKTTLAKKLTERFNMQYVKESVPPEAGYPYYMRRALELPENAVVDRFHLGEVVYPQVVNDGRTTLGLWEQHHIERVLYARGAILILATANHEEVLRRHDKEGETFISKDQVQQVLHLFRDKAFKHSLLPRLVFDSSENEHGQYKQLFELSGLRNDVLRRHWISRYEGIGGTDPDIVETVIVGERYSGHHVFGDGTMRAFGTPNASSSYLNMVLAAATGEVKVGDMKYYIDPASIYLTNAFKLNRTDVDDEPANMHMLRTELEFLRPQQVIALGKRAADFLKRCGIIASSAPHPQFQRRFKNQDFNEYVQMIRSMLLP